MAVESSQFQSPATFGTSAPVGQVAPPTGTQVNQPVPGMGQPQPMGQPAQQQTAPVAPTPQGPSVEEIQRQLEQERQTRLQRDQQVAQMQGAFQQIQTAAQAQEQQRQFDNEMQVVLTAAKGMSEVDADRYITNQVKAIDHRRAQAAQQEIQRVQQQTQTMLQQAAAPQYAKHLADTLGLSERGLQKLIALGDPNMMYNMAQHYKADEDWMNSQLGTIQNGQVQTARTQEVLAMQNAGLGAIGGQNTGSFQVEIPDDLDPDEKARRILNYQRHGPSWQPR